MNDPLVSIQIPTYNQKQYIKEALDSALAQTYDNLQIIVSDDCSPEYDIFQYLKEYVNHPKILIHRNEKNLGRVGNYRNTLYNLVEGEWFINLDGDDYFVHDQFVNFAISKIHQAKDKVVAFQGHSIVEKITKLGIDGVFLGNNSYLVDGQTYIQYLDNSLGFTHGSLMYNVESARSVNFYNIDTLDIDYFSYLKILKEGKIIFWSEKVYNWRQHGDQETLTLNFEKVYNKFEEFDDLVDHYLDTEEKIKHKMLTKTKYDLTIALLIQFFKGDFLFSHFVKVVKITKCNFKYWLPVASLIKRKIINK